MICVCAFSVGDLCASAVNLYLFLNLERIQLPLIPLEIPPSLSDRIPAEFLVGALASVYGGRLGFARIPTGRL